MFTGILILIWLLKFYDNLSDGKKEIVNYIIVGGLTTVVSLLSYYLFRLFITDYMVCTVLSWVCAVLFAYITNRLFVFKSSNKVSGELVSFVGSRILSLLSEMATMFILVDLIKVNDKISKILVQFLVLVLNYIFSKIFVFKKKKVS